jgi:putative N-acetylmannosamine-6-phosphate epimerase
MWKKVMMIMGNLKEVEELCKKGYKIIEVDKNIHSIPGGKSGVVILKKESDEKKIQIVCKNVDILFE